MAQTVQRNHYAESGCRQQGVTDEVLARGRSGHGRRQQEELGRLSVTTQGRTYLWIRFYQA